MSGKIQWFGVGCLKIAYAIGINPGDRNVAGIVIIIVLHNILLMNACLASTSS